MAQRKDAQKRIAIRNATVAEVLDSGVRGASVARIAKRAGISTGTVYVYFSSKEALLFEVFLEIKTAVHRQVMDAVDASESSEDAIRRAWSGLLTAMLDRPEDFAFAEYIAAAQIADDVHRTDLDAMAADITGMLRRAVDDSTLEPAPIEAIYSVLVAPASLLVRSAVAQGRAPTEDVIEATFEAIWAGIRKRPT